MNIRILQRTKVYGLSRCGFDKLLDISTRKTHCGYRLILESVFFIFYYFSFLRIYTQMFPLLTIQKSIPSCLCFSKIYHRVLSFPRHLIDNAPIQLEALVSLFIIITFQNQVESTIFNFQTPSSDLSIIIQRICRFQPAIVQE